MGGARKEVDGSVGGIVVVAADRDFLVGQQALCDLGTRARVRHQEQQEAGDDQEAEQRDDQRQHLRRGDQPTHSVTVIAFARHEAHAVHGRVVHAGDGEPEGDRAERQPARRPCWARKIRRPP